MNWLKRKFWMWWFFKCPVGYSFMGHENGKLFWFYAVGVYVRYKKGQYISLHLRERPTPRALDATPAGVANVNIQSGFAPVTLTVGLLVGSSDVDLFRK